MVFNLENKKLPKIIKDTVIRVNFCRFLLNIGICEPASFEDFPEMM